MIPGFASNQTQLAEAGHLSLLFQVLEYGLLRHQPLLGIDMERAIRKTLPGAAWAVVA